MDTMSYLLGKKAGGGSGTSNYNDLSNKPSINGVTLSGDKSTSDLGIVIPDISGKQDKIDSTHKLDADLVDDTNSTNKMVSASDKTTWSGKQDALVSGTNIKTINNESILGSGNIDISGGGGESYVIKTNTGGQIKSDTETTEILEYIYNNFDSIDTSKIYLKSDSYCFNPVYIYKYGDYLYFYNLFNNGIYTQGPYGINYVAARTIKQEIIFSNGVYVNKTYSNENGYIILNARNLLSTSNTATYTPTGDYNPATKKYVDDKITSYTGYDATKTQVLKNVNGTLTWVDE